MVWKPDTETSVPLWIIILAILAGLLLLALLIYVLYKVSDTNGDMRQNFTFETTCKREPVLFFCSLDSLSDLCPTTWPWRKHKSSPSLKPRRGPALTIPGKATAAKEGDGSGGADLRAVVGRRTDHWNSTVLH